jgi:N-acetylmuramoyl-L-alanine amidase
MMKKISLIAVAVSLIALSAFFMTQNLKPVDKVPIEDNTPDPVIPEVIPLVIVIDSGHGKFISLDKEPNAPESTVMKYKSVVGATGTVSRVPERDINLAVALQLKALLEDAGYRVIMTHTDNTTNPSNIERAKMANDLEADLMIRIHNDSSTNASLHGASVLVPGNVGYAGPIVDVSRQYGTLILDSLIDQVGMSSRGLVTRTDQTGFNWSKVPVVTVEMGFLSNAQEEAKLIDPAYQTQLAKALFTGIQMCFRTD